MGADMITEAIFFYGKERFKDREGILHDAAENLTDEQIEWFIDYFEGLGWDDEQVETSTREEKIKAIQTTVGEVFDCLDGREVTYYDLPFGMMYLTGGMSWGDAPTVALHIFNLLNKMPDYFTNQAGIGWKFPPIFDLFMEEYEDKMPETLKKEMDRFRGALNI